MSASEANLLDTILALPEKKRIKFVEALLASLPEQDASELDETEFNEELRRRREEMKKDPKSRVPWSKLKDLR